MKNKNILSSVAALIFVFNFLCFAQQDYQVVQKFKSSQSAIEHAIKNAESLDELNQIQSQIDQLKSDNQSHKDLLDKSLYPDNFNIAIQKLNEALTLRKGDFTQINTLQTQVSQIQVQLDSLTSKNAELLNRVQELEVQGNKDRHTILVLQRNLRELRYSLRQRDLLVMTMLDSLLPASYNQGGNLSSKEKQKLYSETKRMDIISNIKKAINDNVQFLSVTSLTPEDLNSIRNQKQQFEKIWMNVGPEISKIYSSRNQSIENLNEINSEFDTWQHAIDMEAWNSIAQEFSNHGIILEKFTSGTDFSNVLISYINDEIKNVDLDAQKAAADYHMFVDSVWLNKIEPIWVPYLIDNKMWTSSEKDKIEAKITEWKKTAMPASFNWLYVIIPLIIILLIVLMVRAKSSGKKKFDQYNE